jgi:crotonobetainyl-CoA:carnitine CoA-transferase CaiB-like acyl-CoA transferase
MPEPINKSLCDIRVLEIGDSRAVRLAGMILRDCGADVVRINLTDDNNQEFMVTDRSKGMITVSEFNDEGQVKELLSRTDIVIWDETPSIIEEMIKKNITKEDLLISCYLPSFSSEMKECKIWNEDVVSAASGLYETPVGSVQVFSFPLASTFTAFHAVNAIAMALIGRERNGKGYKICIPLQKTSLSIQMLIMMIRSHPPLQWEPFRWLSSPFMGVWRTAGDEYIYIHLGMPRHLRTFLFRLESAGFIEEKQEIRRLLHKHTRRDPVMIGSVREAIGILRIFKALFRKRTADYWEELLTDAGLCCSKIRTFTEWKNHRQVLESEEVIPIKHDDVSINVPGKLMDSIGGSGVAIEKGERYSIEQIFNLWTEKKPAVAAVTPVSHVLPLEGMRVLDFSRVIAGPFTGRLLAESGAEVLQVTLRGNHLFWEEPFHIEFNAGKRSIDIDCSKPGGRETLSAFVNKYKPDIIVHNFNNEAVEKLGIDYVSMTKINPQIVYVDIKGYSSSGPWCKRPGFEWNIQASSGIVSAYSGNSDPKILSMPYNDMSTGLISSFSTALACFQKERGKGGNHIKTTLAIPSIFLLMDNLNKDCEDHRLEPVNGYYRARDISFYLSVKQGNESLLYRIPELQSSANQIIDKNLLKKIFLKKRYSYWLKRIDEFDIGNSIQIVPKVKIAKLLGDDLKKSDGLFAYKEHEGLGKVLFCKTPVRMEPAGLREIPPAEPIGKSTGEYLKTSESCFTGRKRLSKKIENNGLRNWLWILHQGKWFIVILWKELMLRR